MEGFEVTTVEDVVETADATTIDDSYLAHLSERLANEEKGSQAPGSPDPAMEQQAALASPGAAPPPEGSGEIMELSQESLMPLDESAEQAALAAAGGGGAQGPSDLLQTVPPPPPQEEEPVNPMLNPATVDRVTSVSVKANNAQGTTVKTAKISANGNRRTNPGTKPHEIVSRTSGVMPPPLNDANASATTSNSKVSPEITISLPPTKAMRSRVRPIRWRAVPHENSFPASDAPRMTISIRPRLAATPRVV